MYNILLLTTGAMELNCCSKWWCWRKWADINADTQMNAIFCNLMSTLTRASTGRRPFNFLTAEKWRKWFQTYFYIWLLWTHIKSIPFCLIILMLSFFAPKIVQFILKCIRFIRLKANFQRIEHEINNEPFYRLQTVVIVLLRGFKRLYSIWNEFQLRRRSSQWAPF